MKKLTCIIIDDEIFAIKRLQLLISNNIDYLEVVATYDSAIEAIKGFLIHKPDIIFTDIEMPGMTGLEFLDAILKMNIPTQPIIVSAYEKPDYLKKAIELSLVEYLIKPIISADIINAVNKAKHNIEKNKHLYLLPNLVDTLKEEEKILFKTVNGTLYEKRGDIIALEADSRMCILHSKYQDKRKINESLIEVEDRLLDSNLVRIGRSHIFNLKYVYEIIKKTKRAILRHEQKTYEFELSENACNELMDCMNK